MAVILADAEHELFPLWYYVYVVEKGRGPAVLSTRLTQFDWYLQEQHRRHPETVPAEVVGSYAGRIYPGSVEGEPEGDQFRLLKRLE